MCLLNVVDADIFVDTSFFFQCGSNIINVPVIFGVRLSCH